jgi:hypothetical protein
VTVRHLGLTAARLVAATVRWQGDPMPLARFADVPLSGAHYESVYFMASDPTGGRAIWVRHTVRKPPGRPPVGSLWFTDFGLDAPRAAKANDVPRASAQALISIGDLAQLTGDGAAGHIAVPGLEASWELSFTGGEPELMHLPKRWLYSAPLPKTKSTSPRPDMQLSGWISVNGEHTVIDGWRGMLGHNWGSEHAHRWVWLRGAGFEQNQTVWLDCVLGRLKVGPVVVPWIANGVLSVDGTRRRIGGIGKRATVLPRADGIDVEVSGLRIAVDAPPGRSVGWEYADPVGAVHEVRNCSNAGMRLEVDGRTLTTPYGGVYELGAPQIDAPVVIQPFPDW